MCDFLLKKVSDNTHTQRITRNKKRKKFVAQPVTTDGGETRTRREKTNEIMTTNPTNR